MVTTDNLYKKRSLKKTCAETGMRSKKACAQKKCALNKAQGPKGSIKLALKKSVCSIWFALRKACAKKCALKSVR